MNEMSDGNIDIVRIKYMSLLIRKQRKILKMTQEELGIELGVSYQQIQKYEKGVNTIHASMLPRLCWILRLDPYDFLMWDGNPVLSQPKSTYTWPHKRDV